MPSLNFLSIMFLTRWPKALNLEGKHVKVINAEAEHLLYVHQGYEDLNDIRSGDTSCSREHKKCVC